MAILAKGIIVLFMIFYVKGQQQSNKHLAGLGGFTPIIVGHRHEDLESREGNYQPRYIDHPSRSEKVRQATAVDKDFDTDSSAEDKDNFREYTVGAHFQVTHPTSYAESKKDNPLKTFDPIQASYSYTNFHVSGEKKYKDAPVRLYKTKTFKKPFFKPSRPYDLDEEIVPSRLASDPLDYYELPKGLDQDPRDFKPNFKLQEVPNLYPLQKKFRGVASKGQVEKFLEDQQKLLDEAVELQLLNDPNPAAKGTYQQFLKSKDDERIEREYEDTLRKAPLIVVDSSISKRPESHKFVSKRPLKKAPPKGLGSYRTPKVPAMYHFSIDY